MFSEINVIFSPVFYLTAYYLQPHKTMLATGGGDFATVSYLYYQNNKPIRSHELLSTSQIRKVVCFILGFSKVRRLLFYLDPVQMQNFAPG